MRHPVRMNSRTSSTSPSRASSDMSAIASTRTGRITPATPSTPSRLKMLLPTRLPALMSKRLCMIPTMVVASSGAEVPAAMIVTLMTHSLTPKARAEATADSTRKCAPRVTQSSPSSRMSRFVPREVTPPSCAGSVPPCAGSGWPPSLRWWKSSAR